MCPEVFLPGGRDGTGGCQFFVGFRKHENFWKPTSYTRNRNLLGRYPINLETNWQPDLNKNQVKPIDKDWLKSQK